MEPVVAVVALALVVIGFQSFAYYLRWRNGRRERERSD